MRSQVLITVLLAVLPENVSAGLIRYHDRPVRYVLPSSLGDDQALISDRHGHYIRSFNQSTVAVDASQSVEPTSVTSLFSTSQSPSATTAATALSKQIGSVPAEGSGESAAKIDPESLTQRSSSLATPPSSSAVPSSSQSKQIGSVPVQGSGPGAATFNLESFTHVSSSASSSSSGGFPAVTSKTISDPRKVQSAGDSSNQSTNTLASATPSAVKPASTFTTRLSLGTGIATAASQPQSSQVQPAAAQSGAGSQSAPSSEQAQSSSTAVAGSSAASVQSSGLTASSGSTASSSTQPSGPSLTAIPVVTGGNVGIANAYNQQFKNLTPESPCNSKDRTQAHACINGLFAECNEAGRYTMTACAQGQQCFALPMPAESTGIFVQCDKPDDANQKLQSSSASSSTPIIESTTAVGVSLQTGNPTTPSIYYADHFSNTNNIECYSASFSWGEQRRAAGSSSIGIAINVCNGSLELNERSVDYLIPIITIVVLATTIIAVIKTNGITKSNTSSCSAKSGSSPTVADTSFSVAAGSYTHTYDPGSYIVGSRSWNHYHSSGE
ncbi:MAG: hypothetical protein Q9188_002261 [Gyalolechia gomerana]